MTESDSPPIKVRHVDYYADEFLTGTRNLTDAEVGVYWRACSLVYSHGGPVEIDELQRWCQSRGRNFRAILGRLVETGKLVRNRNEIVSKRALNELEKGAKRVRSAFENGSKGGRPHKQSNGIAKPDGLQVGLHTAKPTAKTNLIRKNKNRSSVSPPEANASVVDTALSAVAPSAPAIDPVKDLWDRGVAILGEKRRSLLGQMCKKFGQVAVLQAIGQCEAEQPVDPIPFFLRCCEQQSVRPNDLSPGSKMLIGGFNAAIKLAARTEVGRNAGDADHLALPLLDAKRAC